MLMKNKDNMTKFKKCDYFLKKATKQTLLFSLKKADRFQVIFWQLHFSSSDFLIK